MSFYSLTSYSQLRVNQVPLSSGGGGAFSNTLSTRFDGIDDFCQTASTYSELDGQTKASFSMWLNPTSSSTLRRTVFQIGDGSASGFKGVAQLVLMEGIRIDFGILSQSFFGRGDISSINYGSWNHLLITVDLDTNPEFKCYVNGVDVTTGDNMANRHSFTTATQGLMIGEWFTGLYDPFLGAIDEFAIWSGTALTSSDATAIYNNGQPNNLNDSNIVATAPTTWYRMGDGDVFPILKDTNGSADLTMTNMTSGNIVNDVPTTPSFSNVNSFIFDGIDEYFLGDSNYSQLDGQNKATFSAWIKPTATNLLGVILHAPRNTSIGDCQFQILIDNGNRLRFNIQNTGTYIFSNTGVFTADSWAHILVCYDGSVSAPSNSPQRGQIFINGIDQTSVINLNTSSFNTSTGSLYISEHSQGFWNPFSGNIDEVAIWSGTDLRNDVATIYNGGVANDLNNNGLTAPTTWFRMGDNNASWNGSIWSMSDVVNSYSVTSANMLEANKTTDVPT